MEDNKSVSSGSTEKSQESSCQLHEINRLKSLNSELLSQNTALRSQIDSSILLTEKIQSVYKENSELKSQICRLKEENDDLSKMLQIKIKTISELKERYQTAESYKEKINDVNKKDNDSIKISESELKREISNLNETILKQNLKNEQILGEKAKLESDFTTIFEAASNYFDIEIKIISDLLPLLHKKDITEGNKGNDEKAAFKAKMNSIINEIKIKNQKKMRKLKTLLSNEIKKSQEQQEKYIFNTKQLENKHEGQVIELNSNITSLTSSINQKKKQLEDLLYKNEILVKEKAKLESQLQLSTIKNIDSESEKIIQMSRQISDLNDKLSESFHVNQEMKDKIPVLVSKNRNLKNKIASLIEKIDELKENLADETNRNHTLSEQFEKRSIELIERLSVKEKDLSNLKLEYKSLKNSCTEFSKECNMIKLENESIKEEKDHISSILKLSKDNVLNNEKKMNEYTQKIAQLNSEITSLSTKLEVASRPINYAKLIPLACWSVPEIPKDLKDIVEDIVKNETLELPTKLRNVLSVIVKWFISKNERTEKELQESKEMNLEMNSLLTKLKEFLSQTFHDFSKENSNNYYISNNNYNNNNDKLMNTDNFLSNVDIFTEIVEKNDFRAMELFQLFINKKNECFNDLFDLKNKMDAELLDLLLALRVDRITDAVQKVNKLYSKNKKLKIVIQKLRISGKKTIESHTTEIHNMNLNLNTKNTLIDELNVKNQSLLNEIDNLRGVQNKNEERIQQLKSSKKNMKEKIKEKINQANIFIQNSKKKYDDLNDLYNNILIKHEELENSNNDLREVINDLTNTKKENEVHLNEIICEMKEMKLKYKEKIKNLKVDSIKRYDTMVDQMKSQNKECRDTIMKMNIEKSNLIDKNENLENLITELNLKIQKIELKNSAILADNGRDHKSKESQYNARILSLKTEYTNKLEGIENEQKRIFELIRKEFGKYVDVKEGEEEEALKGIAQKLKSVEA